MVENSFLYVSKGKFQILDSRGKFHTQIDLSRRIVNGFQNFRQLTGIRQVVALSVHSGCKKKQTALRPPGLLSELPNGLIMPASMVTEQPNGDDSMCRGQVKSLRHRSSPTEPQRQPKRGW